MTATTATPSPAPAGAAMPTVAGPPLAPAPAPLCFVVDEESSIRHFLSLVLHGAGIDTMEFAEGAAMRAAIAQHTPDLVFHNVSLDAADAIDSMVALGASNYRGAVQLMSARGAAVLEHVKAVGIQHKLTMLPVLKKPFETEAILTITRELKLGMAPPATHRVALGEVLAGNWIEFWFQPKINLRRKQLAGAELVARARHPQHGVVLESAFLPGAADADLLALARRELDSALKAAADFAALGLHLKLAVNIPLNALAKLDVADTIRAHAPAPSWPGLVIDVPEDQVLADLPLASELARRLEESKVGVAVDDFGRGYSTLARLGELPFAELKLDRSFVAECGTDKVNAPLCKTVIDLAHNFGRAAVATGVDKAADAVALVSMGCDFGQGFLLGQPMPEERFLSLLRQRAATQGRSLGAPDGKAD